MKQADQPQKLVNLLVWFGTHFSKAGTMSHPAPAAPDRGLAHHKQWLAVHCG